MPAYSDIYVISEKRDVASVNNFLDHFLPEREESADEYELPQYSNAPDQLFTQAIDLMKYCSANKDMEHAIYWRSLFHRKPEYGMVFYLRDGHVIYGLSTEASDKRFVSQLLLNLKLHLESSLGYIAYEAPPDAENMEEFIQQVEATNLNR